MKSKKNSKPKKDKVRKERSPQPEGRSRADAAMLRRSGWAALWCGILAFLPVIGMLVNLMVFRHEEFSQRALNNQTRSTRVSASRGSIFDRNMNVLAVSSSVETVFLDPVEFEEYEEDVRLISDTLAKILHLQPSWVLEMATDTESRYQVIARKQPKEVTDQIRNFIHENDIIGIHMEPDSKRIYPNGSLAAQVIGFTNAENNGAEGIEAYYNRQLRGTEGRVITTKGNFETEMPYSYEKYYEASDGASMVLTLDTTLQYYLEKHMQAAVEQCDVQNGAFGMIMNAKTGEVLAMATLGSYDPNDYLTIGDPRIRQKLDQMEKAYLALSPDSLAYKKGEEAYQEALADAQHAQWRNRCVSDGYEPGSTFKIITMAAAIEEGTTTVNDSFYCGGQEQFYGRPEPLHCWQHSGHGTQTTTQALENSCNLALAHIGLDLGGAKFYEYAQNFGLLEATGVGMAGESSGYFFPKEVLSDPNANGYDAAVIASSFGQTFEVTPIQLVRALCAVVNGGYLMQPYIVSEVLDGHGNVVEKTQPQVVRQVISEETSRIMCDMIQSVVDNGTARNAQIAGYSIGGKTGTAEKTGWVDENGNPVDDKIVSFVGVAPMEDPQYVILVALDTPSKETGLYISGGVMAGPVVRRVFEDMLPYLGVPRDLTGVDMSGVEVSMPDVRDYSETEAAKALHEESLEYEIVGDGKTVTAQIPEPGAKLPGNSEVILYMGEEAPTTLVQVPDFRGMTISEAHYTASNAGLYVLVKGADSDSGYVTAMDQDIEPGKSIARGTTIQVGFTDHTALD